MSPQAGKKQKMLDRVAEEYGVAVVVLDEKSREISVSNNNSICRALTSSSKFSKRCANYCGVAYRNTASGDPFEYQCYAGLKCTAIPVSDQGKRFVAIVGRTFVSAEKYREATDRAIARDWREFPTDEFFDNILIAGSASSIENAVNELAKFRVEKPAEGVEIAQPKVASAKAEEPDDEISKLIERFGESSKTDLPTPHISAEWNKRRVAEAGEIRSLAGRISKLDYST